MDRRSGRKGNTRSVRRTSRSGFPVTERGVINISGRTKRITRKNKRHIKKKKRGFFPALFNIIDDFSENVGFKGGRFFLRRAVTALLTVGICVLLIFGLFSILTRKNAYEVFLDDEHIGYIKLDKNLNATDIQESAVTRLETELGSKIIPDQEVTMVEARADKEEIVSVDTVITDLRKSFSYRVAAAVIVVNGTDEFVAKNEGEASEILQQVQARFSEGGEFTATFVETVEVKKKNVRPNDILTREKIYAALTKTNESIEDYVILQGDGLSKIASKFRTTTAKLEELNGITVDDVIREGNVLKVPSERPYLSVRLEEEITQIVPIPKKTEIVIDDSKPRGYSSITQQGKDGQQEVTYRVTKVNGVKIAEDVIGTPRVIEAAINEVVVEGL